MARSGTIPLLTADPDFARLLRREDRAVAETVNLPLRELPAGRVDLSEVSAAGGFAAVIIDGMLLQTVRMGEHTGLHLLGPGDLVSVHQPLSSALISSLGLRASVRTRLAIFDTGFLHAARNCPPLIVGLHARGSDQSERMLVQLMICQLPRVDDRLLAMFWLVAETWGRVTVSGTMVPVRFTHGALGGLIGARRSTVTLALKQLAERGAVVRQAEGWLLLERPMPTSKLVQDVPMAEPMPAATPPFNWGTAGPVAATRLADVSVHSELRHTVARLRSEHQDRSREYRASLQSMVAARELMAASRQRITLGRLARRSAPSS